MANYLCPVASIFQWFSDAGVVLSGGKINTYLAGTSTPAATYTDITGATPNANPIVLASNGRLPSVQVWQAGGVNLKIIITDSFGNQLGPSFDQISGINDPAATLTSLINPASGSGADLVANAMRSYDLIATVRAANVPNLSAGQTLIIDLEGGTTINDGAGGFFYWNASSTSTDDGGVSTIKPTAAGATGRYIRLTSSASTIGSFTATLAGCTTSPTFTVYYTLEGGPANGKVSVMMVGVTGTSNSTSTALTGWPVGLRGLTQSAYSPLLPAEDNTALGVACYATIPALTGNVVLTINNASGNWTNSGTKGLLTCSFSYLLK
jgi:hypothetical protein